MTNAPLTVSSTIVDVLSPGLCGFFSNTGRTDEYLLLLVTAELKVYGKERSPRIEEIRKATETCGGTGMQLKEGYVKAPSAEATS